VCYGNFVTSLLSLLIAKFASMNHPRNYMAVLTQFPFSFVQIVVRVSGAARPFQLKRLFVIYSVVL
jgi:hypothetical protein